MKTAKIPHRRLRVAGCLLNLKTSMLVRRVAAERGMHPIRYLEMCFWWAKREVDAGRLEWRDAKLQAPT